MNASLIPQHFYAEEIHDMPITLRGSTEYRAKMRACVIGTLTTHGFLPRMRTQEEPGGELAPTEPVRLTDTPEKGTNDD